MKKIMEMSVEELIAEKVKAHSGVELNTRADALAKTGICKAFRISYPIVFFPETGESPATVR